MISQLKKIFPSLIHSKDNIQRASADYQWFITQTNEVIGIKKIELQHKEKTLLELFLTPYHGTHPPVTTREKNWSQVIFDQQIDALSKRPNHYRFIYFCLSEALSDPADFREAIAGVYPNQTAIMWNNQQEGIIIEEEKTMDEDFSYEEMIEVFTSDFFIDLKLFVGPFLTAIEQAPEYYEWIVHAFNELTKINNKAVMSYVSSVPYLLSSSLEKKEHQFLIQAILKETSEDEELLRTIQIFLECNSNTSLTAKQMYMHRNSLQYRIDKFIEKTEIDVKQFEGALSVYLTLLLKNRYE